MNRLTDSVCPCGSKKLFSACCDVYLRGDLPAPTAEELMRSRYTAYCLRNSDYLLQTWDVSTRPDKLDLNNDAIKWIGLKIKQIGAGAADQTSGTVEFIARYRSNGRAHRLHEVSEFRKIENQWFYLRGIAS